VFIALDSVNEMSGLTKGTVGSKTA